MLPLLSELSERGSFIQQNVLRDNDGIFLLPFSHRYIFSFCFPKIPVGANSFLSELTSNMNEGKLKKTKVVFFPMKVYHFKFFYSRITSKPASKSQLSLYMLLLGLLSLKNKIAL